MIEILVEQDKAIEGLKFEAFGFESEQVPLRGSTIWEGWQKGREFQVTQISYRLRKKAMSDGIVLSCVDMKAVRTK